jgi:hypothetical protein
MLSHASERHLAVLAVTILLACTGHAQAGPTATQQLHIAVFAGGTSMVTGLIAGKSIGITTGADFTFLTSHILKPSLELRGTYPIENDHATGERSFLAGPRFEYTFGRVNPYVDIFVGRGKIEYLNGGYASGNILYISSITTIYSPGLGLDYDLSRHLALKADFQYQCWRSPVVASGTIHPDSFIIGAVYRLDFNRDDK